MDIREIKLKDLDPQAFILVQVECIRAAVGTGTAAEAGQADHHRGRGNRLGDLQHRLEAAIDHRGGVTGC